MQIKSIQVLRAIAFIGVFLWHTEKGIVKGTGNWGVCIFFILSGFLLTIRHYEDGSNNKGSSIQESFRFAIKRVSKLYPFHIAMMLFTVPFELMREDNNVVRFLLRATANVCLVQSWIPNDTYFWSFNWVAWYLSSYLFLLFLFPVLMKYIGRFKYFIFDIILVFLIQVLTSGILNHILIDNHVCETFPLYWFVYINPVFRLGDFIIGMCLGLFYIKNTHKERKVDKVGATVMEVVWLCMVCFVFIFVQNEPIPFETWWSRTQLYIPVSTFTVWVFAANRGVITEFLVQKLFVRVGDLSVYGFLTHQVVIRYCNKIFERLSIYNTAFIISMEFILVMASALVAERIVLVLGYGKDKRIMAVHK